MSHKLGRRMFLTSASSGLAVLAMAKSAFAKTINRFSLSKSGHALKGYDTTAYFKDGKAVNGVDALTLEWKGAKWRFSTQEEVALFQANPEAYAPQFGGYCTRAMSLRKEVPGDPEVWRIRGNKLYVFFAPQGGKIFDKGPDPMIALAQKHWDTLSFKE